MRIFIDEAGNFVAPANGQSLFSLVLPLVIPSSIENDLLQAFLRLRDTWPNNAVEIKGARPSLPASVLVSLPCFLLQGDKSGAILVPGVISSALPASSARR